MYYFLALYWRRRIRTVVKKESRRTYLDAGCLTILRLLYIARGELIHVYTPLQGLHVVRFHLTASLWKSGSSNWGSPNFLLLFDSLHGKHFLVCGIEHGTGHGGVRIILWMRWRQCVPNTRLFTISLTRRYFYVFRFTLSFWRTGLLLSIVEFTLIQYIWP